MMRNLLYLWRFNKNPELTGQKRCREFIPALFRGNLNMDLKVYPNPADQYIVVETGSSQPSTFKLFDFIGNLMIDSEISDKEQLSVKQLEAGMYYYKIISESRLQVGKIMIRTT
jgi:hypothetical protein